MTVWLDGDKEVIEGDLPFKVESEEVKARVKEVVAELDNYDSEIKNGQLFKKRNLGTFVFNVIIIFHIVFWFVELTLILFIGLLFELAKKFLASNLTDRNREVARKVCFNKE